MRNSSSIIRPLLVQMMIDNIKKESRYREDIPKEWMRPDFHMEDALIKYIEELETQISKTK